MVLAYHLIFTAYGFWLPNDPRGSWSDFVRAWELLRFGPATKVQTTRSVAHRPHNIPLRLAAKNALRYTPVKFNGFQARAIARGFSHAATRSRFTVFACSILPEHVHMVVLRHRYHAERIIEQFKGEASKSLINERLHPFQQTFRASGRRHSPWTEKGWKVFLDSEQDIHRAVRYVQNNPAKENYRPQSWHFIKRSEYAAHPHQYTNPPPIV